MDYEQIGYGALGNQAIGDANAICPAMLANGALMTDRREKAFVAGKPELPNTNDGRPGLDNLVYCVRDSLRERVQISIEGYHRLFQNGPIKVFYRRNK